MISVTVIDPLPAFSAGLTAALSSAGFMVEQTNDAQEWVRLDGERGVVATVDNPEQEKLLESLRCRSRGLVIAALLSEPCPARFRRLTELGCRAVLDRTATPEEIAAAFTAAVLGHGVIPQRLIPSIVAHIPDDNGLDIGPEEVEWLRTLASGVSVSELGARAGYSSREMHRRLSRLYRQLHVRNRMEALLLVARRGIL